METSVQGNLTGAFEMQQLVRETQVCRSWSRLVMAIGLFGAMASSALAQPVSPQSDELRQLQSHLKLLQAQIEKMQPVDEGDSPFADSRVKSIGTQRTNRVAPPIVDDAMYIRLYDLSDIFSVSPHYPAIETDEVGNLGQVFQASSGNMVRGGFGGGGSGGVFSIPAQPPKKQEAEMMNLESAQVSMKQLVSAITATVAPEKWGDDSDEAKIQFLGNTLLITANSEMHVQINNLLNLFREHWGKLRTISIQAYWVRSNPLAVKMLLDADDSRIGAGVVAANSWTAYLELAQSENRVPYAALLTGHNNQTLHSISGRHKQLTLDATPFQSTTLLAANSKSESDADERDDNDSVSPHRDRLKSVVGFRPVRESFHQGSVIQATPLATRGGNFVILDLHSKVNELIAADRESQPSIFVFLPSGEKAEVKLDAAEYVSARLSTTVRCPKDQIVLAGGMTFDGTADADQPVLYLFVKVAVHTITEDKSDWSDASSGKTTE